MAETGRPRRPRGDSFDRATAVRGGPERWWPRSTRAGRWRGGRTAGTCWRWPRGRRWRRPGSPSAGGQRALPGPADLGPAELEVRPRRPQPVTARVTLVQEGTARLEALVTAGRIDPDADPVAPGRPDGLAPVEDCVPGRPELPAACGPTCYDISTSGSTPPPSAGSPAARAAAWRCAAGPLLRRPRRRPPGPAPGGRRAAPDQLRPRPGWAPTVELTVYLRGVPALGRWLALRRPRPAWQGGWFDEEAEVWDSAGRLVAQSRQLAGARPAAPAGDARPRSTCCFHLPATAAVPTGWWTSTAAMGAALHETEGEWSRPPRLARRRAGRARRRASPFGPPAARLPGG